MSEKTVQDFFKKVESDEDLANGYRSLQQELAAAKADEDFYIAKIVQFASQNGHIFTAEDLTLAAKSKQSEELSDDDLDTVAGGLDWGPPPLVKAVCFGVGVM